MEAHLTAFLNSDTDCAELIYLRARLHWCNSCGLPILDMTWGSALHHLQYHAYCSSTRIAIPNKLGSTRLVYNRGDESRFGATDLLKRM